MSRKGLAIWLLLFASAPPGAIATPSDVSENEQQILAHFIDEVPPARLRDAVVFLGGDLAAVRLPAGAGPVVYILERNAKAKDWSVVARITALDEEHFGDTVLLSPNTILVAAPNTADAGLGPGATYVFQRHVGGTDHWGLVAKLTPHAFPPTGTITVQQLSEDAPQHAPPAPHPTPVDTPPPVVVAAPLPPVITLQQPADAVPPPPTVATPSPPAAQAPPIAAASPPPSVVVSQPPPPPPAAVAAPSPTAAPPSTTVEPPASPMVDSPATAAASPNVDTVDESPKAPNLAAEEPGNDRPLASAGGLRYIAVANMREQPRALKLASNLRDQGYASEVHRNDRDFFVVTLAHLPLAEAKKIRDEAVAAGDISRDAYLIVGSGFREKISP